MTSTPDDRSAKSQQRNTLDHMQPRSDGGELDQRRVEGS